MNSIDIFNTEIFQTWEKSLTNQIKSEVSIGGMMNKGFSEEY